MTQMSALGRPTGVGSVGLSLEVAEDGSGVHPEIPGRPGPIAPVPLEDLEDVLPSEVLASLGQRNDSALVVTSQIQVVDADERLVGQDDRLLDPVLQLPNVPRPVIVAHPFERLRCEALDHGVELGRVLLEEELCEEDDIVTSNRSPWISSGNSITTKSAAATASPSGATSNPSSSARCQPRPLSRAPTTTRAPLSRSR